jgi:formate-dependent phosphoribosylglycinamide formyltransferase (GAR transformylase)
MADTTLLIDVIKEELKSRDKTYADMAEALEMSESTVKRMFSKKEMPLSRRLCRLGPQSHRKHAAHDRAHL